jgi:hypothetical protein
MVVFWDAVPSSLVETDNDPDDGGCKYPVTSVSLYQNTQRNIPKETYVHIYRRQNL